MAEKTQHCRLVRYSYSGNYVYTEIDLPSSAGTVTTSSKSRVTVDSGCGTSTGAIATSEDAFYRPDDIFGHEGLRSAGFATGPRFPDA